MPIIIGLPVLAIIFTLFAFKMTGLTRWLAVIGALTLILLWAWYFIGLVMIELPD